MDVNSNNQPSFDEQMLGNTIKFLWALVEVKKD